MKKAQTILSAIAVIIALMVTVSFKMPEDNKATSSDDQSTVEPAKCFDIMHGVNIAHFLSQSKATTASRAAFFTEKDIRAIKNCGFDHIRLPIDEVQMFAEDGTMDAEAFALLKSTIDCCIKNELKVVVDMHILRSHHFTSGNNTLFTEESAQEYFYELWRQISGELHGFPNDMLAYELLNEPQAPSQEKWNKLVRNCYNAIRELEPQRVIVIGSNPSQSYQGIKYLEIPQGDHNIIISFHYYNPFLVTHYRAPWTHQKDFTGAIQYPGVVLTREAFDAADCDQASKDAVSQFVGEYYDRAVLRQNFSEVVEIAKKYGLQVYCGEYGCLSGVPAEARQAWHSDMESVFDELGIARAIWDYKDSNTGFGIFKNGVPDKVMYDPMHLQPR